MLRRLFVGGWILALVSVALLVLPGAASSRGLRVAVTTPTLTASPASALASPIVLSAGSSQKVTISNNDGSKSTSALTVSLSESPATAGFVVNSDLCSG